MNTIKHIKNWLEGYVYSPLALALFFIGSEVYRHFTHRPTTEDPQAILGYIMLLFPIMIAFVTSSLYSQQNSLYLNKEEACLNAHVFRTTQVVRVAIFIATLWFLHALS